MHLGRRGRALLGFGLLDVVWGIRLLTVETGTTEFYTWLDTLMPLPVWSAPWFTVAALCFAQVAASCDRLAFAGAIGIKVAWAVLCLSAWTFGRVNDAWPSAALWLTFAWCVFLVAGWPEPMQRRGAVWTPPLQ